jgi:hypothetical protein
MTDFHIGQHLIHPSHGNCTVTFVGSDYVGIELDDGQQGMVKKETFLEKQLSNGQVIQPDTGPSSWPESTFVHEGVDVQHYLGSHWRAFFDDPIPVLKRIPEMLQKADPWIGGVNQEAPRCPPDGWRRGSVRAWPNHRQGLMLIISIGEKNTLSSVYPFVTDGGQHSLIIRRINVWESGVEAQIEAELGPSTITFFDIAYAKHRLWYEAGKSYEFILVGIAYDARLPETMEMEVTHHPDEIAWDRVLAEKRGEPIPEAPSILSLRGMAMFMPIDEWDADDYSFRGPVKAVKNVDIDMLGQQGWFVKVTVMRFGDHDVDLDMLITRRAWPHEDPPSVGKDIEGSLWLQGYLWDV